MTPTAEQVVRFFKRTPSNPELGDALLALALSYRAEGRTSEALAIERDSFA